MKYFILLCFLFVLAACHQNRDAESMDALDMIVSDDFDEIVDIPVSMQPPPPGEDDQTVVKGAAIEKKIIKTGKLTFKTGDTQKSYQSILQQLKEQKAFIESENQTAEYDRKNIRLTIRVLSENFDSLFSSLASQPVELDERRVSVEDVTEKYYDLQARIKNRKALEDRYTELLKKADSIKDMLEIERTLNNLRTEIEIEEGKLRYLSRQVRYSTIHLYFYELLPYTYSSEVRPGFGARLAESLSSGWQGFLSFLIGLIRIWPFLLLLTFLIWGILKYRSKKVVPQK